MDTRLNASKRVSHRDTFAKYAALFLKMSRSSLTRANPLVSCQFSDRLGMTIGSENPSAMRGHFFLPYIQMIPENIEFTGILGREAMPRVHGLHRPSFTIRNESSMPGICAGTGQSLIVVFKNYPVLFANAKSINEIGVDFSNLVRL